LPAQPELVAAGETGRGQKRPTVAETGQREISVAEMGHSYLWTPSKGEKSGNGNGHSTLQPNGFCLQDKNLNPSCSDGCCKALNNVRVVTYFQPNEEIDSLSRASQYTDLIVMSLESFRRIYLRQVGSKRPIIHCPVYVTSTSADPERLTLLLNDPVTVKRLMELRQRVHQKNQLVVVTIDSLTTHEEERSLISYVQAHYSHPGHMRIAAEQIPDLKRVIGNDCLIAGQFNPTQPCYPLLSELMSDTSRTESLSFFLTLQ
jgi:hypothetical protein